MLTLTVPVSSAVISSVCMPLARNTVATMMPTEASITMALCFRRVGIILRYPSCKKVSGRLAGADDRSFGLYII